MSHKVFILGLGAQKAGTTWLHHELTQSPETNMGELKEYKALRNPEKNISKQIKRWRKDKKTLVQTLGINQNPSIAEFSELSKEQKQILMMVKNKYYFQYFKSLVTGSDNIKATGDISPHYCVLNKNKLRHTKRELEKIGFQVKVVYLMRDPVERIWSQLRMIRRKQTNRLVCSYATEAESLEALFAMERFARNTHYEITINNIEKSFDPKDIFYDFYENLFQESTLSRLSQFLGIAFSEPDFQAKINASPKNERLSLELNKKIALEYKETYVKMIEKFGPSLYDLWPNAKFAQ